MDIYENYKVVVIGSSSTGKSSFVSRLENKGFTNEVVTIGVNTITRKTKIGDIDVNITVWDTAGQEKHSSLTQSYFKNCHGVFIFYDVNDQNSFDKVKSWNRQIEQSTDIPPAKVLIAAKCDGVTRLIDSETGIKESSSIDASYFETSSKDNIGIKEAFEHMANILVSSLTHKIVVIGEIGVGKSCFIRRLAQNDFFHHGFATAGVDFINHKIKTCNKSINMQLWDTCGSNRAFGTIGGYIRRAHGVCIVYDVDDLGSFREVNNRNMLIEQWADNPPVKLLIAAQCDKSKRKVDTNMGKEKAESIGATYFETSALENFGIKEAFDYMVKEIGKIHKSENKTQPFIIKPSIVEPNKTNCC